MSVDKQTIKGNRKARKLAVQALYQWHMSGADPYEIEAQFHTINDMSSVNQTYFHQLLQGIIKNLDTVEAAF